MTISLFSCCLDRKLAVILDLPDHDTILQDAAVLDFYVSGFWWGKEQGWNEQQISGLVTVHHILIENIKGKEITSALNIHFKTLNQPTVSAKMGGPFTNETKHPVKN